MHALRPFVVLFAAVLPAQGAVDFQRQVLPILESRCVECHATAHPGPDGRLKKPKGGVVLDSKAGITGKADLVVARKPDESLLLQVVTLPADDEDRMPPAKKGAPLSKEQTALIASWIEQGASFGSWTGRKAEGPAKPAAGAAAKVDPLVRLQQGVAPLPAATLAPFATGPFEVRSVGDGSPLLVVSCRGNADTVDDRALEALAPIASHVADLDLARTRVGDGGCTTIAAMPRLVALDLRQSAVGDKGVQALAACAELRTLNLFGTRTGDYGVAALAGLRHLEHLYVWQTDVSVGAAARLRDAVPGLRVVIGGDLPEPMPEGTGNQRRRR
jgi:hypothetical protein